VKRIIYAISLLFSVFFINTTQNSQSISLISIFDDHNSNITSELYEGQYGKKFSISDTHNVPSGYSFAFWVVNDTVRNDLPFHHQFTITSQTNLMIIFSLTEKRVVVFVDTNNKVLSIKHVLTGEIVTDDDITLPNKPGYIISPQKWDKPLTNITEHTIIKLQYLADNLSSHTITVNGANGSGTYNYNDFVTLNAPLTSNGESFQYWMSDNQILSYNPQYSFTVVNNQSFVAVYSDTDLMPLPQIILSSDLQRRIGYKSYLGQYFIPDGFSLIEYGLITSQTTSSITLDSTSINRYQGITQNAANEFVMSITSTSHQYARAYLVVENSQGELLTLYNEIAVIEDTVFEPFSTNIGATYTDGSFTGENGLTWNYIHMRNQDTFPITGTGVMLRHGESSISTTLPNGVSSFSFDYRKAFTGTSVRQLIATFTDSLGTTKTFISPTFGTISSQDSIIYNLAGNELNMVGEVQVLIKLNFTGTTGRQTVIDNFEWKPYVKDPAINGNILQMSSNIHANPTVDLPGPIYSNNQSLVINAPAVEGYLFKEWKDLISGETISSSNPYEFEINSHRSIQAIYESEDLYSAYTIEFYEENITDDNFTLVSSVVQYAYTDTSVVLSPQKYGFSVDSGMSVLTGTASKTSPLTLSVYYLRNEYTVQFNDHDGVYNTQVIKYQSTVSQPTTFTYEAYDFLGWSSIQNGTSFFNFATPITNHMTLYAVFDSAEAFSYSGYYEGADGLTGSSLITFLRNLTTSGYIGVTYGDARYFMGYTDRDLLMTSMVRNIYNGKLVSYVWASGIESSWNREHVWPQSRLGSTATNSVANRASDIHNLRTATPSVNTSRSNKNFDWTTTPNSYYPGDADRGDVARILFYMVIRYSQLQLVEGNPPDDGTLWIGNLSALLQWHILDPVDDFERQRNERIYSGGVVDTDTTLNKFLRQNNRNPFIDHPEFVEKIWGPITLSNGSSVTLSSTENPFGNTTFMIFDIQDFNKSRFII
jgi:endonuclease I